MSKMQCLLIAACIKGYPLVIGHHVDADMDMRDYTFGTRRTESQLGRPYEEVIHYIHRLSAPR